MSTLTINCHVKIIINQENRVEIKRSDEAKGEGRVEEQWRQKRVKHYCVIAYESTLSQTVDK